jgi:hypothetical protein
MKGGRRMTMVDEDRFSALRHGLALAVIEHDGRSYEVWVTLSVIGETDFPDRAPSAARWWGTVTGLPTDVFNGTSEGREVTVSLEGRPSRPAFISPPDRIRGEGDPLPT